MIIFTTRSVAGVIFLVILTILPVTGVILLLFRGVRSGVRSGSRVPVGAFRRPAAAPSLGEDCPNIRGLEVNIVKMHRSHTSSSFRA